MKHFLIAGLALVAFPAFAGNPDANISCNTDSECTVIQSVCPGDWAATNITRVEQTKAYYSGMKGMKCVGVSGKKPAANCVDHRCSLYMP